jgi:outer membrane cobalamin receptor
MRVRAKTQQLRFIMNFSNLSFRVLRRAALSSLIIAGIGRAQTSPSSGTTDAPAQLDTVVVQGRDTDLVGTAQAASQGIVGARELEARPLLRRGELLEVIPGVVITQHSGGGKANQYFLRGFNLDHGTDFL